MVLGAGYACQVATRECRRWRRRLLGISGVLWAVKLWSRRQILEHTETHYGAVIQKDRAELLALISGTLIAFKPANAACIDEWRARRRLR